MLLEVSPYPSWRRVTSTTCTHRHSLLQVFDSDADERAEGRKGRDIYNCSFQHVGGHFVVEFRKLDAQPPAHRFGNAR